MSRARCCPAEPRGHYYSDCPRRHARRAAVLKAVLEAPAANDLVPVRGETMAVWHGDAPDGAA